MAIDNEQKKGNPLLQFSEELEKSEGIDRDSAGDSADLGAVAVGPYVIGSVEPINGEDGKEVTGFLATRHELKQLALHWMQERLEHDFDWFLYQSTGSSEWRWSTYVGRRLTRLHDVLGSEAMERLWEEAIMKFRKARPNLTDDDWRVFRDGDVEEQDGWRNKHIGVPPAD